MRKLVYLGILLFLSVSLFSQEQGNSKSDFPFYRHEFQFGLGDPSFSSQFVPDPCCYGFYNNNTSWFANDEYVRWDVLTPVVTVQYKYRLKKWLWLGGMLSYHGSYFQRNDVLTDERIGVSRIHSIAIMPAVRFSWLNKKIVTLYSGVALGAAFSFAVNEPRDCFNIDPYFVLQLTYVGVEVGKKWFGFAEIGTGYKGFASAGFGFRFNAKNN
ncbi:hypothetical protein LJC68_05585 [Bacteroidales bacterium OttesenSCG-928-B11]|nr:hypothetical protein [Bacteroidales bacterium OttesenSCG-928-C03]MDL2312329.1 hypothetical protein [Bacteroidales bacterium OttesenSCG-928-B11]